MENGNRNGKRRTRMEIEMEFEPVSKIPSVQVSQKTKDEAQRNLDEICLFEGEKTIHQNTDFDVDAEVLPAFLYDPKRRYRKEDLSYNFSITYFMSWIKMSPFGVDPNSKNYPRVQVGHGKWWKNMISFGWFLLGVMRTLAFVLSTVHFVVTGDAKEELGRMTLMICLTTCATVLMYSMTRFMLSPIQHTSLLANSVFKYLDDEPTPTPKWMQEETANTNSAKNGPWKFRFGFGSHTLIELLMIHYPILLWPICGIIPLMSIVDPSFPLLLVSLLPPESRFSLGFFLVALFDFIVFTYYMTICHMMFYFFIGMHRIQEEAGLTIKHLTREPNGPGEQEHLERINILKALKRLRLLHIWTQFFNASYSSFVYGAKLNSLSAAIFAGFGFIKMIQVENWPYAAALGLLFLEGIIPYNVVFGKAYEIPEKVQELKREIRQLSYKMKSKGPNPNQNGTRDDIKYMEKFLRSIPWLGVKDGVYKMERMTCANFLEFAIQQISSLVLGY